MVVEEQKNQDIDSQDDIEKRRPKPFRYISDIKEISDDAEDMTETQETVMTDEKATSEKLREQFETAIGVGDIDVVEQVIKKHKQKRETDHNVGFM